MIARIAVPLAALVAVSGARLALAQQPVSAPAVTLSLDDAFRVAERESETVRVAEAGVLRARGQQYQARSQYLPQINGSANYQKTLQSQFQAITKQSAPPPDTSSGPKLSSLCTPEIPAGATAAERQAALQLAQTCGSSGADLSGISRIFASPYTFTLGLTGSQTLFAGGRIAAANQIANASKRVADIGVTAARAQLRLDVAQAYYNAVLADRLVTISESSYVQAERAFRQTSLGQQVGNVAEFDLLRAQVTRDNQRPVLIQARSQRDVAFLQLRQMLNLPTTQPLVLTTDLPLPPTPPAATLRTVTLPEPNAANAAPNAARGRAGLTNAAQGEGLLAVDPREVLAEDPRVASAIDSVLGVADTSARERAPSRQARENVTVQRNLLKQARAQRLPQIALSSAYQRISYPSGGLVPLPSGLNQFYPNWTAAISVSLPIFAGGRIRGDELVAEAGLREAEQSAKQTEEFAALDAQTAIAQLAQAEATWLASAGTAQQASRAYTISEVRYREGISTLVELSDSRLLLQQAQWNAVTAARDLQIARLKLSLLKDLPLSAAGGSAASRGSAGGSTGGSAAGGASSAGAAQGSSSTTTQQSAARASGGSQQAGLPGGGIP
ncbi:outer membrane efflux protein [Gemmatirosa kalamazoonensis]|uniref:Outer membrane efflux protein n=1 Tax=Gemmatirosa kalamazoonensis TaxID=861299 RepID=W0RGI7_9BACT|nr:TolC family protein [Gemmatirosa kalamazoonensis]AHG89552.1 outer membrane efflux protein [Gemmatirosa kalamazoonensis]